MSTARTSFRWTHCLAAGSFLLATQPAAGDAQEFTRLRRSDTTTAAHVRLLPTSLRLNPTTFGTTTVARGRALDRRPLGRRSRRGEEPRQGGTRTYFYHGYGYGSDAVLSPLTVLLNKGLSPLQFSNRSRALKDYRYGAGASNVFYTLTHPKETIEVTGLRRFIESEVFPLTFSLQDSKWFPNYTEHLLGGGITYTGLREWYESRGVPHARLWAGITSLTAGLLNETVENTGQFRTAADHLADVYLFDIPSVFLFNIDGLNRFFADVLQMADWSPQASFTPDGEVHNNGQYISYHWDLPILNRFSGFMRLGFGGQLGFGYRFSDTDRITLGFGRDTDQQLVQNAETREFTISTKWSTGIFWDRNNSLLASVLVSELEKDALTVNVYPGIIPVGQGLLGFWLVVDRDANPTLGFTYSPALGTGLGVKW